MRDMIARYEEAMAPVRQRFEARLRELERPADANTAAAFLMHICAQGVAMTRDVPAWVSGNGRAALVDGHSDVAHALLRFAAQHGGRHILREQDLRSLVIWWNGRFESRLHASSFMREGELEAVGTFRTLHTSLMHRAPFAAIAIAYEMERLGSGELPRLLRRLTRSLDLQDLQAMSGLSLLGDFVPNTSSKYTQRALQRFLERHPETLRIMVEQGSRALSAYLGYIEGCAHLARMTARSSALALARRRPRPTLTVLKDRMQGAAFAIKLTTLSRAGRE